LQRNEMMNVISFSEAGTERAKIVSAVLDLVGEL
jgi:effector-associated domain 11 (EAD11)-containing protein